MLNMSNKLDQILIRLVVLLLYYINISHSLLSLNEQALLEVTVLIEISASVLWDVLQSLL